MFACFISFFCLNIAILLILIFFIFFLVKLYYLYFSICNNNVNIRNLLDFFNIIEFYYQLKDIFIKEYAIVKDSNIKYNFIYLNWYNILCILITLIIPIFYLVYFNICYAMEFQPGISGNGTIIRELSDVVREHLESIEINRLESNINDNKYPILDEESNRDESLTST